MHLPFHPVAISSLGPEMTSISHPHTPESHHCQNSAHTYLDPAFAHKSADIHSTPQPNSDHSFEGELNAKSPHNEFVTPIRAPHAQHQHIRSALEPRESDDIMPRTPTPPSPTASISGSDELSPSTILSPSSTSSSCSTTSCCPSTPCPSSSSSSPPSSEPLSLECLAHRFTDLISYPLCQLLSSGCSEDAAGALLRQFDDCINGFQTYSASFPHLQKHTQTFIAQLSSKQKMLKDTFKDAGIHLPSDPASSPPSPPTPSSPPSSFSSAVALTFPCLKSSSNFLDDFRELRTLRSTLFGYLKLYEHRESGRKYAVKSSLKSSINSECLAENPLNEVGFLRRVNDAMKKEIQLKGELSSLHGGNFICKLMAEYETSTHLISVLQFASGGDLFDYLDKKPKRSSPSNSACKIAQSPLNVQEARYFFIQLLQGVSFLHHLNICHLDLSLENLLLDEPSPSSSSAAALSVSDFSTKRLFICDFGAAREMPSGGENPKKELPFNAVRNNRPGKLSTMSHEVFSGKDFHGSLSDAYSCGVLFFMFLTSVPPYEFPNFGDKRFSLIFSGQLKRLIDAWKMNDRVPPEALEIISNLICPEERRWTVEQVLKQPWIEEGMKQMQNQTQCQ